MSEEKRTKINTNTIDIKECQIELLSLIFPEFVSEGKIDLDLLRSVLYDKEWLAAKDAYGLGWTGKREAFDAVQAQSKATLYPVENESVHFETTKNIFIEGENLEILKLLFKSYYGSIRMIYIDPPYNTGTDLVYKDDYSEPLRAYLEKTGQIDAEGNKLVSNPDSSGRFHSDWLSMMYPRLLVAHKLLREDGVIFVSIDDHEVHNLRHLMDEILGEENFIALFVWKSRKFRDERAMTHVSTDHEYIIAYSRRPGFWFRGDKRDESKFSNPDNDSRGPWMSRSILGLATAQQRPNLHYEIVDPKTDISYSPPAATGWRYERKRLQKLIDDGQIIFPSTPDGRPREKKFRADIESDYISFPSIIDDVHTADGTAEIREIFGFQAFDFPKPSELIRRLIEQTTKEGDVVLDFFAGSGSTAHAVLKQNRLDNGRRTFICVQLPEPVPSDSEAAQHGLNTIADIAKERMRRVCHDMQKGQQSLTSDEQPEDLGFKVFKLSPSNLVEWKPPTQESEDALIEQMTLFDEGLVEDARPLDVVYEVILKEGFDLNSTIRLVELGENEGYKVIQPMKNDEEVVSFTICLDREIKDSTIQSLGLTPEAMFVCLDSSLNDSLKMNLRLQCKLRVI